MKLAVVGSRGFNDYELLKSKLDVIHKTEVINCIVSGGAYGADTLAEKWAKENNVQTLIFLPDWNKYGKSAGFIRNELIVQNCDTVMAFWDGKSRGTKLTIELAKKYVLPIIIVNYENN